MHKNFKRYSVSFCLILVISSSASLASVFAATSESISNPYQSASPIKDGSIVSLSTSHVNQVEPSNTSNEERVVGVAIASEQVLLELNDATNTTQVVSNGIVETLVSTLNGAISIGTQIAVTPLDGIGASAQSGDRVIGVSEANFNSTTPNSVSRTISDTKGNKHKIYIGYVPVLISVPNPTNSTSNGVINGLRSFFSNIAGHEVSITSLIFIFMIGIVSLISIIVLIYSAITGGLISIGRNPLARSSIVISILQVFAMVILVAATSIIIIYFILH